MSLKHGLLGLLKYDAMTGYELNKAFNERLGHFWQATASQICFELDKMQSKGWLISERVIQEDKPNKRVYSITQKGQEEMVNWLNKPHTFEKRKNSMLMRVYFGSSEEKEATLRLLEVFNEKCIQEISAAKSDDKLTALYNEIMNKARIEWVEKALNILMEKPLEKPTRTHEYLDKYGLTWQLVS